MQHPLYQKFTHLHHLFLQQKPIYDAQPCHPGITDDLTSMHSCKQIHIMDQHIKANPGYFGDKVGMKHLIVKTLTSRIQIWLRFLRTNKGHLHVYMR